MEFLRNIFEKYAIKRLNDYINTCSDDANDSYKLTQKPNSAQYIARNITFDRILLFVPQLLMMPFSNYFEAVGFEIKNNESDFSVVSQFENGFIAYGLEDSFTTELDSRINWITRIIKKCLADHAIKLIPKSSILNKINKIRVNCFEISVC